MISARNIALAACIVGMMAPQAFAADEMLEGAKQQLGLREIAGIDKRPPLHRQVEGLCDQIVFGKRLGTRTEARSPSQAKQQQARARTLRVSENQRRLPCSGPKPDAAEC